MEGIFANTMANMNWTDIQASVEKGAIVLLPLGVIEEHGPQLCLGTDIYIAHLSCVRVKEKLEKQGYPAIIAPPFYWGICQSTGGFIGSFTARKETVQAMVFDIIASLRSFGFHSIFGINAHGDIDHSVAMINAFQEANAKLGINARYVMAEEKIKHFGLKESERFLCPLARQTISVSTAKVPDVHGGDIETATIYQFYPNLVDVAKAEALPPVALEEDKGEAWLFGGHIKELSPEGYLGSPADYRGVDVSANEEDYAMRISTAILKCLPA